MQISIYGVMHEFLLSDRQSNFLLYYLKKQKITLPQFIAYVEDIWWPTIKSEVWRKRHPVSGFDIFCITLNEGLALYLKRSRGMSNDWTECPGALKAPKFIENFADRSRRSQQWRDHHDFWKSFWSERNDKIVVGLKGVGLRTMSQIDPYLRKNDREWLVTPSGEKPFEGLI